MKDNSFNPAGKIAEIFVDSRLTILFIIGCSLLGVVAVLQTPREENPQIVVPAAEIVMVLPGASASEVEELIVTPLEGLVSEITGVDHTYATALNSVGMVMVRFNCGEDEEESLVKLYDKVMGNRQLFPKDALNPVIKSVDVDDVPIVTVTLASRIYDDYGLKRLADHMIERFRSLEEVSVIFVKGGRDREIRIELDPNRLQAFAVTLDQIQGMLAAANLSTPIDTIVKNDQNRNMFLHGFLASADEVKRLVVGMHQGRPIYLEDVAEVIDEPLRERDSVSRFGFGRADPRFVSVGSDEMNAVTMAIAKKQGTNAVFVADDILERLGRMEENLVPSGVELIVTRNDGQKADDSVNLLMEHLGIAIITVFVVVALFLGLKEAVIVSFTIPLILALTLGADFLFGPTINRITLFALILSLGMLVDAAIVVTENINRHYRNVNEGDYKLAAVLATNEIGNPTNLATFAVMAVFTSLLFLTGMSGQYFFPITFNVPVAMFASLLVAYIITPWAAYRWLKPKKSALSKMEPANSRDRLHSFYHAVISPFLKRPALRYLLFLFTIILIVLALLMPAWQFIRPQGVGGPFSALGVSLKMSPKDNQNTFNITIDTGEDTPIERTDQLVRDLCELLRKHPHITNYQAYVGSGGVIDFNSLLRGGGNKFGPHLAEIRVNLINKHHRKQSSIEIVAEMRPHVEEIQRRYPGALVQLVEDPPGPPVRATILAEIYGPDPEVLRILAGQVNAEFSRTYGALEVTDSEVEDVLEYQIVVDREKAAFSGITTAQIAEALRNIVNGVDLGRVHIKGEKNAVPIRLHVPRRHQVDPLLLSKVFITNRMGQKVPVSELVTITEGLQDRPILHQDNEQVAYVQGQLKNETAPFYAILDLDKRINGLAIDSRRTLATANLTQESVRPDTTGGYQLLWSGEVRQSLDFFRDQGNAMRVAMALIYLLFVAYYRSFIIPLVAMAAIPLGLIGVFPGHWLLGQPFSGPSMIGVIALAGVVVRNSLLIIDFILAYLKEGKSLDEAVREAGAVRLRPILLTALAVTLGSAIMLTDPVFCGLAISLIFGTLSSTILTMLIIPLLVHTLFSRRQNHNVREVK